jgi:hypothetical protein
MFALEEPVFLLITHAVEWIAVSAKLVLVAIVFLVEILAVE